MINWLDLVIIVLTNSWLFTPAYDAYILDAEIHEITSASFPPSFISWSTTPSYLAPVAHRYALLKI